MSKPQNFFKFCTNLGMLGYRTQMLEIILVVNFNREICIFCSHMYMFNCVNSNIYCTISIFTFLVGVSFNNRFHFCVRLYCNRSQMTSWRVNKYAQGVVECRDFMFFTRYGVHL